MTLGERLKKERKARGLSQESIADMMGVTRQAVTKWESDLSTPSSENLIALSSYFDISLDELVSGNTDKKKKPNLVLRSNLTMLALAFHCGMLHACSRYFTYIDGQFIFERNLFYIYLGLLLLCSLWMAFNLRYEEDRTQRKKNAFIELLYCIAQFLIAALVVTQFITEFVGLLLHITILLVYILLINPKCMNRTLTKKLTKK